MEPFWPDTRRRLLRHAGTDVGRRSRAGQATGRVGISRLHGGWHASGGHALGRLAPSRRRYRFRVADREGRPAGRHIDQLPARTPIGGGRLHRGTAQPCSPRDRLLHERRGHGLLHRHLHQLLQRRRTLQPTVALRGELARDDLVPTRELEVGGIPLPAPAVPEAWLEFTYGPNWSIPDPSFVWKYPRSTRRRFENSFGVFNRQRVFWEKTWQKVDKRVLTEDEDFSDVDRFLRLLPEHALVIDLGCGDGRHTERIAAAGHQVLGVDYSFEAIRVARQTQPADVEYRFLNLNDRHGLLLFALELIDQRVQPYFYARNLLHVMPKLGRADLFGTLRGLLDRETFLYATFDSTPVPREPANPLTWTVRTSTLEREAWRWKLGTTVLHERDHATPYGVRRNVTALLWL